jgi:hypothetical protein
MKSAGDNFHFTNSTRAFSSPTVGWNGATRATRTVIPVIKGDVVVCSYNGSGETYDFIFVYAEGENN